METVRAISGHRPGDDAACVPDDFEVGAGAGGLAAVKVDVSDGWVVGVGVVVDQRLAGRNRATAGGPGHVVSVELGVIGGDGGDGYSC